MNTVSRTCEMITKDLTFILSDSQKERKEWDWKSVQVNNDWKLLKFDRIYNSTTFKKLNRKTQTNTCQEMLKLNLWKLKTKKTSSNQPERKTHIFFRGTMIWIRQIAHLKLWRLKGSDTLFKYQRKALSTENSISGGNILRE